MSTYALEQLDGLCMDAEADRALHIAVSTIMAAEGLSDSNAPVVVLDLFDTPQAAYTPGGEVIAAIRVNLLTGEVARE